MVDDFHQQAGARAGVGTAQQFRMVVSGDRPHRWVIHDRASIYSDGVDATVLAMGLTILKTPVRAPHANAHSEHWHHSARVSGLDDPVQ